MDEQNFSAAARFLASEGRGLRAAHDKRAVAVLARAAELLEVFEDTADLQLAQVAGVDALKVLAQLQRLNLERVRRTDEYHRNAWWTDVMRFSTAAWRAIHGA